MRNFHSANSFFFVLFDGLGILMPAAAAGADGGRVGGVPGSQAALRFHLRFKFISIFSR